MLYCFIIIIIIVNIIEIKTSEQMGKAFSLLNATFHILYSIYVFIASRE
jgi:hypothetical protein